MCPGERTIINKEAGFAFITYHLDRDIKTLWEVEAVHIVLIAEGKLLQLQQ